MLHMILNPMVFSFLNVNGSIQTINENPLFLSNQRTYQGYYCYQLCATLHSTDAEFNSMQINQAFFEFPIQHLSMNTAWNSITVYAVFHSNFGTSSYSSIYAIPITRESFTNDLLHINVTELLKEWKVNESPMMEIYLSVNNPNLSMKIVSYCTRLIIEYTRQPLTPPIPDISNPSMISLSTKKCSCGMIAANSPIRLDTIEHEIRKDITYDMKSYTFSFDRTGYYYVGWVLNLRGCATTDCIVIGIRNESTGEVFDFHTPITMPLELYGQHILHVTDTSAAYSLINGCDSPIQLSIAHTQASLIIFKI